MERQRARTMAAVTHSAIPIPGQQDALETITIKERRWRDNCPRTVLPR